MVDERGVPARPRSDGLRSANGLRRPCRGVFSHPVGDGRCQLPDAIRPPRRYRTIADSRRVDCPAGDPSAFLAWIRRSTRSPRESARPLGIPTSRPRRLPRRIPGASGTAGDQIWRGRPPAATFRARRSCGPSREESNDGTHETKSRSYGAGEWGRNRVRVLPALWTKRANRLCHNELWGMTIHSAPRSVPHCSPRQPAASRPPEGNCSAKPWSRTPDGVRLDGAHEQPTSHPHFHVHRESGQSGGRDPWCRSDVVVWPAAQRDFAARRAPSAGLSGGGPAGTLVDQRQHRHSMAGAGGRMATDRSSTG